MSLVFAGVCSHAPGITGRRELADVDVRERLDASFDRMRGAIADAGPDALIIIAAEHFGNFFFDNMPAFAMGMGASYEGPIEDEEWLRIKRRVVSGCPDLSKRIITEVMQDVDVGFCEEWKFDHGIMVPLHFLDPDNRMPVIPVNINCQAPPLTPLHRAYTFGRALRGACDKVPERLAVVGTGGISHWPATPDSGTINEDWDRRFLDHLMKNSKSDLLAYTDEETYRDAGQGGFEIRTFISVAGATEGAGGELWFYEPIPIFAVGCTIAVMGVN